MNHICETCVEQSQEFYPTWPVRDLVVTSADCANCAMLWASVNTISKCASFADEVDKSIDDEIILADGGNSIHNYFSASSDTSTLPLPGMSCHCAKNVNELELKIFRLPPNGIHTSGSTLTKKPTLHARLPALPVRSAVPPSVSALASIEWAKSLLASCLQNHQPACLSRKDDHCLPKRLVRIIKEGSEFEVRLVESDDAVEYFCLSHCWGTGHTLCTTVQSNLASRKDNIPWGEIPKVFRQALEFTHQLGEEYLWIDSLCIIQDDQSDWAHESENMAGIYQREQLTLAASSAEGNDGDMFHTPDEIMRGVRVESLERFEIADGISVRIRAHHEIEKFPLSPKELGSGKNVCFLLIIYTSRLMN